MNGQYEVFSPWAEVDPIPIRGMTPRLTDLNGKTIGLFANQKPMALPVLNVVERKLKERFPNVKISRYKVPHDDQTTYTEGKAEFESWVKGVDTVITAKAD